MKKFEPKSGWVTFLEMTGQIWKMFFSPQATLLTRENPGSCDNGDQHLVLPCTRNSDETWLSGVADALFSLYGINYRYLFLYVFHGLKFWVCLELQQYSTQGQVLKYDDDLRVVSSLPLPWGRDHTRVLVIQSYSRLNRMRAKICFLTIPESTLPLSSEVLVA